MEIRTLIFGLALFIGIMICIPSIYGLLTVDDSALCWGGILAGLIFVLLGSVPLLYYRHQWKKKEEEKIKNPTYKP